MACVSLFLESRITFRFNRTSLSLAAQFDMENSLSAGISSSILHPQSAPVNIPNSPLTNSLGELRNSLKLYQNQLNESSVRAGLLHSTKPVNIPSNNYSPSSHQNLFMHGDNILSGSAGSAPKINNNSFSHGDGLFMQHSSHLVSSLNEGFGSISPDLRSVYTHLFSKFDLKF
jgi:hypothetical protein